MQLLKPRQFFCFLFAVLSLTVGLHALEDPLPSWNEGSAKKAIIDFVSDVTREGSDSYISPKDRIAAFDNDGTLWVEQPMYTQFVFAMESIKELAPKHPEWAEKNPFKAIVTGNHEAMKRFDAQDIEVIMATTHAGMSLEQFHQTIGNWLGKAVHPRFKKPYTQLVYQPMLEVMQLFRDHQFDVYLVSGGGQEFMRVFSEKVYGVPVNHVIGTTGKMKYENVDGKTSLYKLPDVLFIDDKAGKPAAINLFIGQRPVAAFGNSIGDQQMLEWTQGNSGRTFQLLVHHDDAEREYAYGPESKVGTFTDALMQEATKNKWIVVSMKNDWKIIFPWQKAE